MSDNIRNRIQAIKKLLSEYYSMEQGSLIEKHNELLRVFDIRKSVHGSLHPHRMMRVYITRRAIKHFVEKRKSELQKRHSKEESITTMYFAINNVREVIINFDTYECNSPATYIYSKDYSSQDKSILRVAVEYKQGRLEIKSIHFREKS